LKQRFEQLLALALRAEVEFGSATRQRKQLSQQFNFVTITGSDCDPAAQLSELLLDCVVPRKAGGAFELGDERVERACLMMRRAEVSYAGMLIGLDACESAAVRRDLPIPGSPDISTTLPSPAFACCQRRSSRSSSSSRPTSGVASERSASKRLSTLLSPATRQARCGSAKPASGCGSRSSTRTSHRFAASCFRQ
jgi:hypothetical protein